MDFFKRHKTTVAGVLAVFLFSIFLFTFSAPANFSPTILAIPEGVSAPLAAKILADAHIIRYPSIVRLVLRLSGASNSVQTGVYRFSTPQNVFTVVYRLATGGYDIPPARITFPEGTTVRDAAARIAEALPLISVADFQKAAAPYEGYLFPDTYFFPPNADADSIVKMMRANFTAKTAPLSADAVASGHSISDVVIMASLVEKEARTSANRAIVAGILWNRLARGMPLQVDAVFGYIYNRDTYSPSLSDLAVNSPYNTYTHKGLPPGPIDNPGLDSINAALHPTKTNYVYYLTGNDGLMHYATTYVQHQSNLKKYLQ